MCKKIIIIILCFLPAGSKAQTEQGIIFSEGLNWEQIKNKARTEHKNIFIYVFATWCSPCKKMDKEIYTDKTVGVFVNKNFISLKLQMDSTRNDLPSVIAFRKFASALQRSYKIEAYPTYVFLSPDGELIERDLGFKNSSDFIFLAKKAADPDVNYSAQVKHFNKGDLDAGKLFELALKAKRNKEDSLAYRVASAYKKYFIDEKPPKQILKPETGVALTEFGEIFSFKDPVIKYLYSNPVDAERRMKIRPGYAKAYIDYIITRDWVNNKLWPDGVMVSVEPNWKRFEKNIANTFDPLTAKRITLNAKTRWYTDKRDWTKVVKYEIEKIDTFGLDPTGMNAFIVNNMVFEVIFRYSDDREALKKGIIYMEKLLDKDPENNSKIDTYANILYKAGFVEKAIQNERRALSLAKEKKETESVALYEETLRKMLNSQPTWDDIK